MKEGKSKLNLFPDEVLEARREDDEVYYEEPVLLTPEISGYVTRWIRIKVRGEDDVSNVSRRFDRQGWIPVKASEMPAKYRLGVGKFKDYEDCIIYKDVILCKIPTKRAHAIRDAVRRRTDALTEGDANRLTQFNDSKMPVYNTSRHVTTRGPGAERDHGFGE